MRPPLLDEMISFVRAALAIRPQSSPAHAFLGIALRQQGKVDEAIACHRKAIELGPKSAYAYNNLGLAFRNTQKLDEAIAACRKAIELDPKLASPHFTVGWSLKAQGKLDEAIACYRKAIELDPRYALAHNDLGWSLQAQGKLDEAIACYRKAIALDPDVPFARANLGNTLALQGWNLANHPDPKLRDLKRAFEVSKEAVELDPQSSLLLQYSGWILYRAGIWQASIEALEKSCKLQAGGTGDCCQWIVMSLAHGKLANETELPEQERAQHNAEALRWYDQGVTQINAWAPGGSSVRKATRAFRAEAAELLGVNQAIQSLEMLVAAQPNAWESRINLAEAYAKEGQWEKAAAEYAKATEVKPDAWEPWSGRAFIHFRQGQWNEAVSDFSKAIDLAPHVHTNWLHRGHAHLQLAQWDKAAADFGKLVEQWPQDSGGWFFRLAAHAQLNQQGEALSDLRQAMSNGFKDREHLRTYSLLDPIRSNPDFQKLATELEERVK